MKSIFLILPLVPLLAVAAAHADDTFTVLPQQVVSVGDGGGHLLAGEHLAKRQQCRGFAEAQRRELQLPFRIGRGKERSAAY